ncbi:hypothetical protein BDM02DRAFT_3268393 [Thelephora ganbajun]|uniref:Uncharacterized protein n=1 Tax=Thelephora ganbajun TaxID=370292 RepID=A0ACB6ZKI1_THEGA|nr:hypothetical protein BDM02DRAFT_3268393 [Thelephora ganbajun]
MSISYPPNAYYTPGDEVGMDHHGEYGTWKTKGWVKMAKGKDWSRIQMYLQLSGAYGSNDRLGTFEGKMGAAPGQPSENIRAARGGAFLAAKSLSGTPKGALQILARSTLNSAELQNPLKPLESDPQNNSSESCPALASHTLSLRNL